MSENPKNLSHDAAIKALCDCAATVTVLSYQEVIEGYFSLRGLSIPGEPASVAVEAAKRDDIRRSIIRQLGDDPHADRIILTGTDWDIVLSSLSKPTPVEAGALDWLRVAKLAGQFGIRYRTNTALEQFLAALSETQPPRETSTQEKQNG